MNTEEAANQVSVWTKILKDRNSYYALLMFLLCIVIYTQNEDKKDLRVELNKEKNSLDSLQVKFNNHKCNCVEEFKIWKNAFQEEISKTSNEISTRTEDLEAERQRTEELNNTYKILSK